jgi:hypothetical protein
VEKLGCKGMPLAFPSAWSPRRNVARAGDAGHPRMLAGVRRVCLDGAERVEAAPRGGRNQTSPVMDICGRRRTSMSVRSRRMGRGRSRGPGGGGSYQEVDGGVGEGRGRRTATKSTKRAAGVVEENVEVAVI